MTYYCAHYKEVGSLVGGLKVVRKDDTISNDERKAEEEIVWTEKTSVPRKNAAPSTQVHLTHALESHLQPATPKPTKDIKRCIAPNVVFFSDLHIQFASELAVLEGEDSVIFLGRIGYTAQTTLVLLSCRGLRRLAKMTPFGTTKTKRMKK